MSLFLSFFFKFGRVLSFFGHIFGDGRGVVGCFLLLLGEGAIVIHNHLSRFFYYFFHLYFCSLQTPLNNITPPPSIPLSYLTHCPVLLILIPLLSSHSKYDSHDIGRNTTSKWYNQCIRFVLPISFWSSQFIVILRMFAFLWELEHFWNANRL